MSAEEVGASIAALRLRLPQLEGKANKRERQAVSRELYRLENSDVHVAAEKEVRAADALALAEAEAADAQRQERELREEEARSRPVADAAADSCGAREESLEERMHFRRQVEDLFDDYAPTFEADLCNELGYEMPQEVLRTLLELRGPDLGSDGSPPRLSRTCCVDLGCGTGLAGASLRPHLGGELVGCDLSRRMLEVAAASRPGLYDSLVASDAVSFLRRRVGACAADLIVATDVICYMRSLVDLAAAAEASLCVGGVFAFSTEIAAADECGGAPPDGAGWVERRSERIAHCEEYVRWLVAQSPKLELTSLHETVGRRDGRDAIRAHVVVLTKCAA